MLYKLILSFLGNKRFLICFGVITLLFSSTLISIIAHPVLLVLLLILIFILSIPATLLLNAILSVSDVALSAKRVKDLAKQYPQLAELEKQRAMIVGLRLVFFIVAIPMFCFAVYYGDELGGLAAVVICAIVYLLAIGLKAQKLRGAFKQVVVLAELTRAFENVRFDPHKGFPTQEIYDLDLIRGFDQMDSNDWLEAERNGIRFCRGDVRIQEEHVKTDDKGNEETTYETTFQGGVMRFEAPQPYPARLLVITEGFSNARSTSDSLKKLFGRDGKDIVATELDEFDRRFDAYCTDQVAARMILTPQMIEGMLKLRNYARRELAFLFEGPYFYLFVSQPGEDSFEMSTGSHQSVKKQHEVAAAQVNFIAGLIDNMYFKENSRV